MNFGLGIKYFAHYVFRTFFLFSVISCCLWYIYFCLWKEKILNLLNFFSPNLFVPNHLHEISPVCTSTPKRWETWFNSGKNQAIPWVRSCTLSQLNRTTLYLICLVLLMFLTCQRCWYQDKCQQKCKDFLCSRQVCDRYWARLVCAPISVWARHHPHGFCSTRLKWKHSICILWLLHPVELFFAVLLVETLR